MNILIRLCAFFMVVAYSAGLGVTMSMGSPWKIVLATISFVMAYTVALFLLWISGGEDE